MSVRRRLAEVVAGKLDALLSRLEDPGEALDLAYRTLLERLGAARRAVEEIAGVRAGLEEAARDVEAAGRRLEVHAREELATGRRGRAREALARRHVAENGAGSLRREARALAEEEARFAAAVETATDRARAIGAQCEALKALDRAGNEQDRLAAMVDAVREEADEARRATERAEAALAARRAQHRRVEALVASGRLEDLSVVPEALAGELEAARAAPEVEHALHALERRAKPGR